MIEEEKALFKPRSWLANIDFINHLVLFNNLLITVLAEKEGGKSSFGALLQTHLDKNIKSVSVKVTAPCDRQSLLLQLASQLHLNQENFVDFEAIVTQVNERKAQVLFIIDDAHNLPEEFIKQALYSIQKQGDVGYFHLCLLSDYSVIPTLNCLVNESLNHLVHTLELGPLSELEMRTYVFQRAMLSSLINKPLTEPQYKRLYQLTKGNMALVNAQLEPFLLEVPKTKTLNTKKIVKGVASTVGALCLMGVLYVMSGFIPRHEVPESTLNTAIPVVAQREVALRDDKSFLSQIPSWEEGATRELMSSDLPSIALTPVKTEAEIVAKNEVDFESKLVKAPNFAPKQVAKSAEKPTSAMRYTIQLAASPHQVDMTKLRKKNQFLAQTQLRHVVNSRGSWYILTLGDFSSITKAQETANQFPAELTKLRPWVRPVANLEEVG